MRLSGNTVTRSCVANLIQKFFGVLFRHRPFPPDLTKKRSWLYTVGVVGSVS